MTALSDAAAQAYADAQADGRWTDGPVITSLADLGRVLAGTA